MSSALLSSFASQLDNMSTHLPTFIIYIALLVGTAKLIVALLSFKRFISQHFFTSSRKRDLHRRYGGGWAVVTGASDGIGAEYARQLASYGFNVCLVSRTKSKLEAVRDQIKEISPKVETKIIQVDFAGLNDIESYRNIVKQCADLDVSIVVINAGIMIVGDYENFPPEVSQTMLDVNAYHYAMLHKMFGAQLIERIQKKDKRCALIGVSSSSWLRHFPKFTVYTATKAYASYLSLAMQYEKSVSELPEFKLLDLHCFVPYGTATNIVDHKAFFRLATTTKDAVDVALRDLGKFDLSYGTLMNEVLAKFSFIWTGKYLGPVFDAAMHICSFQIKKY